MGAAQSLGADFAKADMRDLAFGDETRQSAHDLFDWSAAVDAMDVVQGGGTTPNELITAQYVPLETEMSDLLHAYLIGRLEERPGDEKTMAISTFSQVWAGKARSDDLYADLEGTFRTDVDASLRYLVSNKLLAEIGNQSQVFENEHFDTYALLRREGGAVFAFCPQDPDCAAHQMPGVLMDHGVQFAILQGQLR